MRRARSVTFNPRHDVVWHHRATMLRWIAVAVALIGIVLCVAPSARSQRSPSSNSVLFAPPNDVAFTTATLRQQYTVREPFAVTYQIANVSAHAVYVPTLQTAKCPSFAPHIMTMLEDSAGRHTGSGYGWSCTGNFPPTLTLAERIAKEDGILLRPGAHVDGAFRSTPLAAAAWRRVPTGSKPRCTAGARAVSRR
jgi:hypothetical protein